MKSLQTNMVIIFIMLTNHRSTLCYHLLKVFLKGLSNRTPNNPYNSSSYNKQMAQLSEVKQIIVNAWWILESLGQLGTNQENPKLRWNKVTVDMLLEIKTVKKLLEKDPIC